MKAASKTKVDLLKEIEELQVRLKEAEEKLIAYQKNETRPFPSESLAHSILDQSTDVIVICDQNGKIVQTSHEAHRFFTGNLLGRPFDIACPLTLASPSPYVSKQFSISSVLAGKILRALEVTHKRDGQVFYFLVSARPLTDERKGTLGSVATLTDITERKRTEQTIARLASFPQLNPDPVVELDLNGNVHYLNPSVERLFSDLQSTGAHHPWLSDLESIAVMLQEDPQTSYVREIKIGNAWYEQSIYYSPEWNRIRVYGREITERKRAEEGLRESFERYRSYIEVTGELGWTTNADGEVVEDIPSFRKFTGQTDEEVKGWGWSKALHPDDLEHTTQIWRQAIKAKSTYEVEYRLRRHDGIYRYFMARGIPVFMENGSIQEWVGTCIDITERKQMEEELLKSRDGLEIRVQERTRQVREQSRVLDFFFKFSTTPFVILDKGFNFIRVNEAYAKACHREVSEFPGHNHFEFYPSAAKAKFEQVVQTKEPYVAIARPFTFSDHPEWGTSYWDWILTPILDDTGETEFLVFSLEDVTKRKRAEEAVKAERQRFNNVLEMLPAYLVLLTRDYHVPFANRFFQERFGESHGKRCFEYLFGRSEPCEICETYTVLKTMAPHHWEWTGPDGRIYDVTDFPFTDTDGSTLILEMGIDITERKRAEEQLKVAHQYTRSLIEASLDPLVTISADGKIMDVNKATEHVTGVVRKQLIGSDFFDYFTDPEKARDGYRQVFEAGSVRDYPLAIRHTSGMITDVLYNATIYRNEAGGIQGIFAAARDITDRKRVEGALRESENRLRVLSSQLLTAQESERKRIAMELHDGIGQMLTAIKFKVETILQEKGAGKARAKEKSFETIIPMVRESVEEVRRMQMDLRPSTLDDLGVLATLGWFCREYQRIYSHIRIEKEIGLQEDEVSNTLKTVIYRLTQEAMNNVAKHSEADFIHLSLRRMENEIQLVIKDNGMGFDLEEILSPERSKRGLGLSSMRERTELSGGTFTIESTPGKGTTVRASWPL